MNSILEELSFSSKYNELENEIRNTASPIVISDLTSVAETIITADLHTKLKKNILLVTYNDVQAKNLVKNLHFFTDKVKFLPKKEVVTYDYVSESKSLPYERIEVLNTIFENKKNIIVTSIETLTQKIISKESLYKNVLNFKVGDICNLEDVKEKLIKLGYRRFDLIDGRGQFSVRGGIIDISTTENTGIRLELWGDEIDSIRTFNIISQRSVTNMDSTKIYPAHEYVLEKSIEEICDSIRKNAVNENFEDNIEKDIEEIKNGNYLSKVDKYITQFYNKAESILQYLEKDTLIFLDEIDKIKVRFENLQQDKENTIKLLLEKNRMIPEAIKETFTWEEIETFIKTYRYNYFNKLNSTIKSNMQKFSFNCKELNYFKSSTDILVEDVKKFIKDNKKVFILVDMQEKVEKIQELLNDNEIQSVYQEKLNNKIISGKESSSVIISVGNLTEGILSNDLNQIIIVANEVVTAQRREKVRRNKEFNNAEKVVFADLKIGDYVVHRKYGIGIYIGVNTIKADGTVKDYIKLKYLGDDILYIPTNALDEIRKYVGGEEIGLKLNKLGSKDWQKITTKVKNNLRAVARELVELYARREKADGFAFSPDNDWQKQFEGSFPYIETQDQLRAIEDVKKDMESSKPMDRLLCGDVGYGKTEVAIRAAFKAVMDHKQVVYLVPTTVLAQQQYESFRDRMKDFPVKVDLLNRFRTTKDQNRIIKELKLGDIDIVVATHKVLGKDIAFKNLGLLIIDEEHRFGVKAKEKIKEYKTAVDVLTMTATPIPRTLHMSVVGVRDMSIIYEPPQNRKPVQTYVLEYDQEVIKEAITKELERDGQVFYLFNNVENIMQKADEISRLVPEANVAYAHGRMTGTQIEDIMKDFVDKRTNVLVCTTILESGIDIPNANTIIVENADRMGLAQLYQIRGRVGRSDRQAYAYITYKRDKLLSEVADKRLNAIKEFTEFGSGFKIAMRDLEIRGAGSLIGEIQHGHLEEVGYDTYCRLLDEVLKEEQGLKVQEEIETQIDLNVTSYIPDSYISDSNQKIEIYQDIALCRTEENIQDVIDELIDRFGNIPEEVENLFEISRIKQMAIKQGISKISNKRDGVIFIYENDKFDISNVNKLMQIYGNDIKFSPGIKQIVTVRLKHKGEKEFLKEIEQFLSHTLHN